MVAVLKNWSRARTSAIKPGKKPSLVISSYIVSFCNLHSCTSGCHSPKQEHRVWLQYPVLRADYWARLLKETFTSGAGKRITLKVRRLVEVLGLTFQLNRSSFYDSSEILSCNFLRIIFILQYFLLSIHVLQQVFKRGSVVHSRFFWRLRFF